MDYSERIKFYREKFGLTQKQLADDIGSSRQIVVRWESGLSVPSLYLAQKVADRFGISVTELMSDGDAVKTNDEKPAAPSASAPDAGAIKDRTDINGKVGVISVLSFVPVALWFIFDALTEAVRQYLILIGYNMATDYRNVTDILENASAAICLSIMGIMLLLWVNRLIACFLSVKDKYGRYVIFKKWNIGLMFIFVNLCVLTFQTSYVTLPIILLYACSTSVAAVVDGIITFFFRIFGKKYVLFEKNRGFAKINLIFFIIRAALIAFTVFYIIYAFAVSASAALIAVGIMLLLFSAAAFLVEIAYLITRLSVRIAERYADKE